MQDVKQASLHQFSRMLAEVIEGRSGADRLIEAVAALYACDAAFAVLNRAGASPVYLADSYSDPLSKQAVQRYVNTTFEINPVHNAIRSGLCCGVYRMADLAPDDWIAASDDVIADDTEEIGFRTPGWPRGLQEVSVLVDLEEGLVGEISLARGAVPEGVPDADLEDLKAVLPLIRSAFLKLASGAVSDSRGEQPISGLLDTFGIDVLSPREAEIVQMILRGHSSLSICLTLDIALTTVKSHRRNAYAKLGISTQQQLFHAYLEERESKQMKPGPSQ